MRSVSGAGIGLFACLLGCWPMPPPDPGRPPPPPEMLPAPPPDPPTVRPLASAVKASSGKANPTPVAEPQLVWDASSRTIRCGDDVALPVPADFSVYLRPGAGGEITVVPPGSPPGAAIVALNIGSLTVSFSGDETDLDFEAFRERYERLATDMLATARRLHTIASGRDFGEVRPDGDPRTADDGIVDVGYVDNGAPDEIWKLVLVHAGPCLFIATELRRPDAAQRFAPMLQQMCATNRSSSSKSRCREDRPSLSLPSR